jgi:hypothetical protein
VESSGSSERVTYDFKKIIDTPLNIAVIMTSGGHFAAAIFQGFGVLSLICLLMELNKT